MCFKIRETKQKPYTLNLKSILRSRSLPVIRHNSMLPNVSNSLFIFCLLFTKFTFDKSITRKKFFLNFFLLFQGNVIIVDTPGFGDNEQKEVAEKMIEYIPNALAIVFVINVAAAGGIQDDRVYHLDHLSY